MQQDIEADVFKLYSPKVWAAGVAWLAIMLYLLMENFRSLIDEFTLRSSASLAVAALQLIVTLLIATPAWRILWRVCPKLNDWLFPDLNGEWEVTGETNWPRINALLEAANAERSPVDMRSGDESTLPPLGKFTMKARIKQSLSRIHVELWNPHGNSPIKNSRTLLVDPFFDENGRFGIAYIFEQENSTDVISDDSKFLGAARIVRDRDTNNRLVGSMWSDRVWRRGMNTAANLTFTRKQTTD